MASANANETIKQFRKVLKAKNFAVTVDGISAQKFTTCERVSVQLQLKEMHNHTVRNIFQAGTGAGHTPHA